MRLKDEVAIITGGGSGMGRTGALRFAEEGAKVVVADLNGVAAEETAQMVKDAGGEAVAVQGDVATLEGNQNAVQAALDNYGKLSIVWANAGVATSVKPLLEADEKDSSHFDLMYRVNVKGPWYMAQAAMPHLKEQDGSMVITASLSGLTARPGNSAYSATKGAAVQLTRALAVEFAPNVRVNSICPVATETPMQDVFTPGEMGDVMKPKIVAGIPMGRLANTQDMADAALFLASREAGMITGHNLPVDGGSLC
ncbi:3-ketoacyl-(acyl-carrier-protein) reductase [Corynebacterium maris DSM 45190]|uniref:3-ketoacyl-(Acyl-carrier-protein) reductase n=1 Tax=Corynebacterium maris DSM 45190 TaxID=1224163 RepID=S5TKE3_9CORY|nr:SDR family oxidoreductase [Corynebacterium maris]AGS35366.1 3-ketoacyl-(acyl-carrier-protein) reductase [Corynebacterium maris DSM 45190]